MKVIALVGQPSSGKDTAAAYFMTLGFNHISTGDIIREEMAALGLPLDREHMNRFSTEQRRTRGGSYPADIAADRVVGDCVISGLRNTAEIGYLKGFFGSSFVIVALEVPLAARYERARQRGRVGDMISMDEFKKQEEIERKGNASSHELDAVIEQADFSISNEGTVSELHAKLDSMLNQIGFNK